MKHQYLAERVVPDGWIRDRYDWDVNEGEGYIERKIPSNSYGSSYHFTVHESGELGLMHPTYIYRKVWEYPEWLGGCCVYQQEDGTWWVSAEIPPRLIKTGNCKEAWFHARTTNNHQSLLTKECFPGWEPPPCKDWKQSLHLNPRRECCGT